MKLHAAILLSLAAAACGGKKSAPPPATVTVGSFAVTLPAGDKEVKSDKLGPGKTMIEHGKLLVILEPMAEPLTLDPAELATCQAYADQLAGRGAQVTRTKIDALPAGKACVVDTSNVLSSGRTRIQREVAVRVGDHGMTAMCSGPTGVSLDDCATLFAGIALAPGGSAPRTQP